MRGIPYIRVWIVPPSHKMWEGGEIVERRFGDADEMVTVETRGNQAVFRAQRPCTGPGLWKAWLVGERGRYLLGTLLPEGDCLRLGRTIPVAQLERQGVWPPVGAEILRHGAPARCPAPPAGWNWQERPSGLITDPLLRHGLETVARALYRETEDGFQLALPWPTEGPFPLTPLFCLGEITNLEGKKHVRFSFCSGGQPRLGKKE